MAAITVASLVLSTCAGEPARSPAPSPTAAARAPEPAEDASVALEGAGDAAADVAAAAPGAAELGPEGACAASRDCPGSGQVLWAARFAIAGQSVSHQVGRATYAIDLPSGSKLAAGGDGSVVVAAPHRGSIDVGGRILKAGVTSVLLVKLGGDGKPAWSALIADPRSLTQAIKDAKGVPQQARVAGVGVDSRGEVVVAGEHSGGLQLRLARPAKRSHSSNGFVSWHDGASGTARTAFSYVDPLIMPSDLVVGAGDEVLLGATEGVDVSTNQYDAAAVFFGRDGRETKRLRYGASGFYGGEAAFGGSGTALVSGTVYVAPGYDGFLAALSGAKQPAWHLGLGGMMAPHIRVDSAGGLVLAGDFGARGAQLGERLVAARGDADVVVAWLRGEGRVVRVRHFGEPRAKASVSALAVRPADRDFALAGQLDAGGLELGASRVEHAARPSGFVAAFDPEGRARFSRRLTGASELRVEGVALDHTGNVFVSGFVEGDLGVGDQTFAGAGRALFVAKLSR